MNYELFIFLFMFLLVLFAAVIVYIGKDKKGMYYEDVIYLENFVRNNQVTRSNYDFLLREFTRLSRNNQDKLRTKRLWASFMEKYRDYWFDSKDLVKF